MGNKGGQTYWIVTRNPYLCCFSVAIMLFLPYLYFCGYSSKANATNRFLRKENSFSVIENQNPSTRDHLINDPASQATSTLLDSIGPVEEQVYQCDPSKSLLKIFMYDLPPIFHFGLLDWNDSGKDVWPDLRTYIPPYPGALNLQHSIDYWLTLDLLSSRFPDRAGPCAAIRVEDSRDADMIFVPFFSSLSYNRYSKPRPGKAFTDKQLQKKLVEFLTSQEEWKRSGGHDHIILAHHPNSMIDARDMFWPCMLILSDFARYPPQVANVEKDIIAPYKHIVKRSVNDSSSFDDRATLLYFQGAIYRKDGGSVRQELYNLLKDEKDIHFSYGSVVQNGSNQAGDGMRSSKFCLNIAGDTPSSNRLFDAIASHCIPVIISDDIELPYEDVLNYSKFCIFVRASDAVKKGFLLKLIRGISREEWTQMWQRLKEVENYFEFQYPSRKDDAVQMIWQAVARKVPSVHLTIRKSNRFSRFSGRHR